ncbi:MAG TPA: hypothetical protein VJN70_05085 [Gemmatimonadaceae bacterium]|nr:hypothetical protein [Gemmatimonadaceae bacterium]
MPLILQVPTPPPTIVPEAPQAPQFPTTTPAPAPQTYGQFRVPQTAAERAILIARRSEMSDQIVSARSRRHTLAREYEGATGANRAGLEQQLAVLDKRIAQLEVDIGDSGRALAAYTGPTTTIGFPDRLPIGISPGQTTAISIIFIIFVLGPLAGAFGRLIWRRASRPALPPAWNDATNRLERLEQAMDTIAVEMERVSEGQRFITKIMTQPDHGEVRAGRS